MGPIGGVLRFDLPGIGVAGVQTSPSRQRCHFPGCAARRTESTRRMAIHNLGREIGRGELSIDEAMGHRAGRGRNPSRAANGQVARFIDEVFPA